jgi:hypothetical protein
VFKKIYFIYLFSFLLGACSLLRKSTPTLLDSDLSLAEKYSKYITKKDLFNNLSVLAADSLEGRETTMKGQKVAANFIKEYFKKNLIPPPGSNNYFQKFNVNISDFNRVSVIVNSDTLSIIKDFYLFGNTKDTVVYNKEVIDVGYGIIDGDHNDYQNKNVKNKIILIKEGVPVAGGVSKKWQSWRVKQKLATSKGALAVITVKKDFKSSIERIAPFLENPQMKMHKDVLTQSNMVPNFCISESVYNNYFKQANKVSFSVDINYLAAAENVMGFIEGGELKDEVLVISAHYDHIGFDNGEVCNGADDDGSGTVSLMSIAKAFIEAKNRGHTNKRSILFLAVSGEEKGLFGSRYYTENPVYPLINTIADLNIDMVGRMDTVHTDINYIYLIGSDKISNELHDISELVNEKFIGFDLDYTFNSDDDPNNFYYRSDHYNFAKNNIPVIFYFSGIHRDYHKPTDDIDKINFDKLHTTAKYVFYTAWELVNRNKRIK